MPAQTLVFATCQHTAPLEALPRHIQTTQTNASTSKITCITGPSNCLTCSLQLTLQRQNETKALFAVKFREAHLSHERSAVSVRNDRDRDFILENGKAALAEIVSDSDKAIREIWRPVIDMWNGASRDARTASRIGGRGGEKEVLSIDLLNRDNGRLDKVQLKWRDGNGRGDVVGIQEIKL
jgi:hypothetical protein